MKNELISIVVPVYKVEKYLAQCLDSILLQSYDDFEVIIVDDGSPDLCPQICDEYARKDSRMKVIHKKNEGLTAAWICGLENSNAKADFVIFIDSDDWIEKDYVKNLIIAQKQNDADMVIAPMVKVYPKHVECESAMEEMKFFDELKLKKEIYPIMLNNGKFHGRTIPISRAGKLIKKRNIYDNLCYCASGTTYSEDLNIIFPCLLDIKSLCIINKNNSSYCYRMNPESMSHAYDSSMLKSILHVYPNLLKACEDKHQNELKKQIYADFLAASVQYYKNELQNPGGFNIALANIEQFSKNELFLQSARITSTKEYKVLNKLIVYVLMKMTWFDKCVITKLLQILKKSKQF